MPGLRIFRICDKEGNAIKATLISLGAVARCSSGGIQGFSRLQRRSITGQIGQDEFQDVMIKIAND